MKGDSIGTHDLIGMGQAYLKELMEVAENRSKLSGVDVAVILANVDLLCQTASRLRPRDSTLPLCRILPYLCRQENIEHMTRSGASPRVIRAIRWRRARTYDCYLGQIAAEAKARLCRSLESARHAGEWLLWLDTLRRSLRLRWYLFRLRAAGRAYRAALPVRIEPLLEVLQSLIEQ